MIFVMATEKDFYRWLSSNIFKKIPDFRWDRLESRVSSNGLPDITYSYNGHHGFIELKYADVLEKNEKFKLKHPVTPSQLFWLSERNRIGGHCYVCIGTIDNIYITKGPDISFSCPRKGPDKVPWMASIL